MLAKKDANFDVLELFRDKKLVKTCAPMVRYSKLQFRNLVKLYDCDLAFTPMILADSFRLSDKARRNEFTTNSLDAPLIAQFAANAPRDFVAAARLAAPFCDGADLNCGCPQRWAKDRQLGCEMLKRPESICDIIKQCRNRIAKPFTVSVKMRLLNDDRQTVEVCRRLERAGVSFLTVHGRTSSQLVGEINREALKLARENCDVPVIANGGATSLEDCIELSEYTGCRGIMVANGILSNPTMFSGSSRTTIDCVQNWLDICYNSTISLDNYERERRKSVVGAIKEKPFNLTFQVFHHHLVFMLEKLLPRNRRRVFNNLKTFSEVLEFLQDHFHIKPRLFELDLFLKYNNITTDYADIDTSCLDNSEIREGHGKFFTDKINESNDDDDVDCCGWSNIFLENG
ncbi:unnamed protein product [Phyllotreta striolata]|uniref:DUS-like FMN-binding domain-containing protein n=1 Tax=Phyllotreta striolata TaxID=444603 RepID=A0A9N9TNV2_PHYSR|nr:unnamed protein product [Phyllotreta striolata]